MTKRLVTTNALTNCVYTAERIRKLERFLRNYDNLQNIPGFYTIRIADEFITFPSETIRPIVEKQVAKFYEELSQCGIEFCSFDTDFP